MQGVALAAAQLFGAASIGLPDPSDGRKTAGSATNGGTGHRRKNRRVSSPGHHNHRAFQKREKARKHKARASKPPRRFLHCWADKYETLEPTVEPYSVEWADLNIECYGEWPDGANANGGTCLLRKGHRGPHQWTPDGNITITFAATR